MFTNKHGCQACMIDMTSSGSAVNYESRSHDTTSCLEPISFEQEDPTSANHVEKCNALTESFIPSQEFSDVREVCNSTTFISAQSMFRQFLRQLNIGEDISALQTCVMQTLHALLTRMALPSFQQLDRRNQGREERNNQLKFWMCQWLMKTVYFQRMLRPLNVAIRTVMQPFHSTGQ